MKLFRGKRNSGLTTGKLIATVSSIAVAAGVLGGSGVVYGPALLEKVKSDKSDPVEVGTVEETEKPDAPRKGFVFGDLSSDAAVDSIEVTIQTGKEGAALSEKLDLHLGLGFPLRLYPLGEDAMNPAFAAFPQKSSLERGQNSIKAGESATFDFMANGEDGQDTLKTTPQLFKDVTVGDLQKIGFASLGGADWILEGYTIKVNGQLFASHDSVNLQPKILLEDKRNELASLLPQNEALLEDISELEAYIATGLASDADKGDLSNKKAELEAGAGPVNELAGQTSGYYPWYVEEDEKFTPPVDVNAPVTELDVTVLAGGGEQPGTRNPMYIKAGGKKFQLTSEMDPLANINAPQEFVISMADLKVSPIAKDDLDNIGVGVIGNEERFGKIPDRAKVQRLVITADGEQVYDSERKTEDRKALEAYWLVPPVHFDDQGEIVENEEKGAQKHLWITGMAAPKNPEPKPIPEPIPNPKPVPVPNPDPVPGPVPNPDPTKPDPVPPLPVPNPNPNPIPNPNPNPIPPAPNPLGQPTTITGAPSGTFVPTGTVDPITGLQQGTFVAGNGNPGFTNLRRRNNSLGPLNPGVFVTPPSPNPGAATLSLADQLKLVAAIANLIKPAKPKPKPGKITQPKASNVRFSDGVHSADLGRPVTVKWDVVPGTAGAKTITSFKVDLFAVNLETGTVLTPALVSKTTTTGNAKSETLVLPDPDGAWPLAASVVPRNKIHLLYLQPRVIPMETAGGTSTAIANAADTGKIVPLLPNPSSYSVTFSLKPGPEQIWDTTFNQALFTVSGSALAEYPGKFQLEDGIYNPATSWVDMALVSTNPGGAASAAYLMGAPLKTLSGFQIAPPTTISSAKAHHVAARNNDGSNQIALVYEGSITYPTVPPATGKVRGYRLVGNLGYLSGAKTSNPGASTASVGMMVDLHGDGATPVPPLRQNAGDPDPANSPDSNPNPADPLARSTSYFVAHRGGVSSAWARLMTNAAGFTVNANSKTTTQAFDIPIRFDLLDAGADAAAVVAAYKALTPTGVAAFTPLTLLGSDVGGPNHLAQDFGVPDLAAYDTAKSSGSKTIGVTFTIKIATGTNPASVTDPLGVFGLRIVPDVYY